MQTAPAAALQARFGVCEGLARRARSGSRAPRSPGGEIPPSSGGFSVVAGGGGRPLGKAEAGAMLGLRDYQVSRELSAALDSLQAMLHAQDHGTEVWKPFVIEAWIRFRMEHQPHPPEDVDETP